MFFWFETFENTDLDKVAVVSEYYQQVEEHWSHKLVGWNVVLTGFDINGGERESAKTCVLSQTFSINKWLLEWNR